MKPQIPAATSQANKMTRQAKNWKTEQNSEVLLVYETKQSFHKLNVSFGV